MYMLTHLPTQPMRVTSCLPRTFIHFNRQFPNHLTSYHNQRACVRQDPDRVRNDVLGLSKHCKTLVPKRGSVGEKIHMLISFIYYYNIYCSI